MLDNTAKELNKMGYSIEISVDMGRDIDALPRRYGVAGVEDMKEALIRSVINNPCKDL